MNLDLCGCLPFDEEFFANFPTNQDFEDGLGSLRLDQLLTLRFESSRFRQTAAPPNLNFYYGWCLNLKPLKILTNHSNPFSCNVSEIEPKRLRECKSNNIYSIYCSQFSTLIGSLFDYTSSQFQIKVFLLPKRYLMKLLKQKGKHQNERAETRTKDYKYFTSDERRQQQLTFSQETGFWGCCFFAEWSSSSRDILSSATGSGSLIFASGGKVTEPRSVGPKPNQTNLWFGFDSSVKF